MEFSATHHPFRLLGSQFTSLPYPDTDCTGKVVIVTGANVGLGLEAARHFVRLNAAKVILGCRNVDKGEAAKADIVASTGREGVIEVWQVDLSSFESVKEFCQRADTLDRLDIVLENAALATQEYQVCEGYERQMTVDVISTFLMALLLLPALRRSATKFNVLPHLVFVVSTAHFFAVFRQRHDPSIFEALRGPADMFDRYSVVKLLDVLITRELAWETAANGKPKVVINMVDPGLCKSQLFRDATFPVSWIMSSLMFISGRTAEVGSRNLVAAALADESSHGGYIQDCQLREPSSFVRSQEGHEAQKKVYEELLDLLEEIEPGIGGNL
ncbi:short-chain dehydrogenase [Biscogniauxia mediterranea]|nr:short-chain dehydrogenase [Biscogniauxia mediterranea]